MVDPFMKHREFTVTSKADTYIYKNAMKTYKITITKESFKFSVEEDQNEEIRLEFFDDFSFLFRHKHLNYIYNVSFDNEQVVVTKSSYNESISVILGDDGNNSFSYSWNVREQKAKKMFDFLVGSKVAQFFGKIKNIFLFWANFFNNPEKGPHRELYFHTEKVINKHINLFYSFFSQF